MNLNEMQSAWDSPRNNLPAGKLQELARRFTHQMIRRRRFQAVWLINTFVWLTVITAFALWSIAVSMQQLHAVGKVSSNELASMRCFSVERCC